MSDKFGPIPMAGPGVEMAKETGLIPIDWPLGLEQYQRKESKMRAYLIALEIDRVEVGKVYEGLPLHCTLVHWFAADIDLKTLEDSVALASRLIGPLFLHSGEVEMFGPVNTIPVNVMAPTTELIGLHMALFEHLSKLGATFLEPQYVGKGYRPHVTHQNGQMLKRGKSALVYNAYIVEALNAPHLETVSVTALKDKKVIARFHVRT